LGDVDAADALHAFFAFFLFFENFAFAGDVAAAAFGDHILANRRDGFAGDNLGATSASLSWDMMGRGENMASLDWSQCPAVESVPGKVSGAWVFKNTRMPVTTVFENLEAGLTVEEVMEEFCVTREQINAVLKFAAKSLEPRIPAPVHSPSDDAHSL
jgi:uncharacterized protein (DUF433 family)